MTRKMKQRKFVNLRTVTVIEDFLKNTSIHGLKYLNNRSSSTQQRIVHLLWCCIIFLTCLCSGIMMKEFWNRYHAHPAISVIPDFHRSTIHTPFPALTVCPGIPPEAETIVKLLHGFDLPDGTDRKRAAYLLNGAFEMSHPRGNLDTDRDELNEILRRNNIDLLDLLGSLRSPCKDIVESCWWEQKRANCGDIFKRSYTFGGLCCSFNYLLESRTKTANTSQPTFRAPRTITSSTFGANSGLTLVFKENQFVMNYDNGSIARITSNTIGLLVFIHDSMAYPDSSSLILQAKQEMQLRITVTEKRNLPVKSSVDEHLPCIGDGATIDYFPDYRKINCHNSCRMKAAMHLCGCIPWLFAPFAGKHAICGFSRMKCLRENYRNIWSVMYLDKSDISCYCPARCNGRMYQVSQTQLPIGHTFFTPSTIYKNISTKNAVLKIYIGEQVHDVVGTEIIATEIYLLSSMGGIFSLFLGCGILSVAEIIYYLYLLISAYLADRRQRKIIHPLKLWRKYQL